MSAPQASQAIRRGDAVVVHYPDADRLALVNRVGRGSDAGEYHLVGDGFATWAAPDGPVVTFDVCEPTDAHGALGRYLA